MAVTGACWTAGGHLHPVLDRKPCPWIRRFWDLDALSAVDSLDRIITMDTYTKNSTEYAISMWATSTLFLDPCLANSAVSYGAGGGGGGVLISPILPSSRPTHTLAAATLPHNVPQTSICCCFPLPYPTLARCANMNSM